MKRKNIGIDILMFKNKDLSVKKDDWTALEDLDNSGAIQETGDLSERLSGSIERWKSRKYALSYGLVLRRKKEQMLWMLANKANNLLSGTDINITGVGLKSMTEAVSKIMNLLQYEINRNSMTVFPSLSKSDNLDLALEATEQAIDILGISPKFAMDLSERRANDFVLWQAKNNIDLKKALDVDSSGKMDLKKLKEIYSGDNEIESSEGGSGDSKTSG